MKISLSGFGEYADTLTIALSTRVRPRDITAVLRIDGVEYYHIQDYTVFVRYSESSDAYSVASRSLRVITECLDVDLEKLSVGIHDRSVDTDSRPELANNIWLQALAEPAPEVISWNDVETRGTPPVYYRR